MPALFGFLLCYRLFMLTNPIVFSALFEYRENKHESSTGFPVKPVSPHRCFTYQSTPHRDNKADLTLSVDTTIRYAWRGYFLTIRQARLQRLKRLLCNLMCF